MPHRNLYLQIYQALSEQLGLADESMILNVFVTKMLVHIFLLVLQKSIVTNKILSLYSSNSVTNLKYWTNSKLIVSKTLQLLNDLSVG